MERTQKWLGGVDMKLNILDIHKYLDSLGVERSNDGYMYISEALQYIFENPDNLLRITEIYALLSVRHKKELRTVERSIRYAIRHLGRTNKNFISLAVDAMRSIDLQYSDSNRRLESRDINLLVTE